MYGVPTRVKEAINKLVSGSHNASNARPAHSPGKTEGFDFFFLYSHYFLSFGELRQQDKSVLRFCIFHATVNPASVKCEMSKRFYDVSDAPAFILIENNFKSWLIGANRIVSFEIALKMNESPKATCCICYNTTDAYSLPLSTKHTKRPINVVWKMILGDESAPVWSASDAICFYCVEKINDYDEAYQKMQLIERELKFLHRRVSLKPESYLEQAAGSSAISVGEECSADGFDVDDGCADSDENSNSSSGESHTDEGALNTNLDSTNTDTYAQQKPVVEPTVRAELSGELKKSDFHCDECGKEVQTYRGLTVRWCFVD